MVQPANVNTKNPQPVRAKGLKSKGARNAIKGMEPRVPAKHKPESNLFNYLYLMLEFPVINCFAPLIGTSTEPTNR